MAEKNLFSSAEALEAYQTPSIVPAAAPYIAPRSPLQHTSVRPPEKIPRPVLEFFQMDPKSRRLLAEGEKIFSAQVFMHEIDEGIRLLIQGGKNLQAKVIQDFDQGLHCSQRLELLRTLLEKLNPMAHAPQKIQSTHKARNNQWGAVRMRMGDHPAVALTEAGVGYKSCNEDAFLLMPEKKIIALADGLGGHPGGEVASGMAIDFFEYGIQAGMEMEQAITFANDAVLLRSKSDPRFGGRQPMACTFASVQLKHSLLKITHVGDTKVLVIRDGKIWFQTRDHTKGQQLLEEGLVDHATAFELNHILNRCLGLDKMQARRDVELQKITLEPGDRILLLTDGVTDNFYDSQFQLTELAALACQGSLSQSAELLLDCCHQRMLSQTLPCGRASKPDNLSLAMLEYRG